MGRRGEMRDNGSRQRTQRQPNGNSNGARAAMKGGRRDREGIGLTTGKDGVTNGNSGGSRAGMEGGRRDREGK